MMKRSKLRSGFAAIASVVSLTVAGCTGSVNEPVVPEESEGSSASVELTKINFGYIGGGLEAGSLLALAEDLNLWEEEGLEVETSIFTNGPLQVTALNAGSLDFGFVGPGALWLPGSGMAKIVMPSALDRSASVIAQPGITSLEELKGKKVGIPEGTTGEMIFDLALQEAGMTREDFNIVPMDPPTVVSAFSAGEIDGAGLWFPLVDIIREAVPDLNRIIAIEDMDNTFFMGYVASNDIVNDNPDAVVAVIRVLRKALDYRSANIEETIEITARFVDDEPARLAKEVDYVKMLTSDEIDGYIEDGSLVKWLEAMNGYFVKAGKMPEEKDPATYLTGDLILEAGR